MTQEKRQLLLLKDLCARLPYHPIVHVEHNMWGIIETADLQVYGYVGTLKLLREDNETFCYLPIEECRPYLRPMKSMTEEEKKEFTKVLVKSQECSYENNESATTIVNDWYLSKGFDVRGLIPKGLALEAPEDMYK